MALLASAVEVGSSSHPSSVGSAPIEDDPTPRALDLLVGVGAGVDEAGSSSSHPSSVGSSSIGSGSSSHSSYSSVGMLVGADDVFEGLEPVEALCIYVSTDEL